MKFIRDIRIKLKNVKSGSDPVAPKLTPSNTENNVHPPWNPSLSHSLCNPPVLPRHLPLTSDYSSLPPTASPSSSLPRNPQSPGHMIPGDYNMQKKDTAPAIPAVPRQPSISVDEIIVKDRSVPSSTSPSPLAPSSGLASIPSSEPASTPVNESTLASDAPKMTTYNVLVLGETQSGKSTLIECMKKYADPTATIDFAAIGNGFVSHTEQIRYSTITTNLPECIVVRKGGEKVNYGEFRTDGGDEWDYEDKINQRKNMALEYENPRLNDGPAIFNLIDTPGLNATVEGDDEKHIQRIFNCLIEAKTIHLLIITISSGPFTQGLQDAIKTYVDMFPDFNGIIAFVHTHFDYKNFHPEQKRFLDVIDLRTASLNKIMKRSTFPHFKIDCDITNKKPIRESITQNTLQQILELATINNPIDMLHTVVNKTRKMRDIDNILRDKFEATTKTIENTLRFKIPEDGDMLSETYRRETIIHELDAKIKVLEEYFARHDIDRLEILHEDRRDMDYPKDNEKGDEVIMQYPVKGLLSFDILQRSILGHGVTIQNETPTKEESVRNPWRSWRLEFVRASLQHAVLHVKLYTAKFHMFHDEIMAKRQQHKELIEARQLAIQDRDSFSVLNESRKQKIKVIVDNHREGIEILSFVVNDVMAPEVFDALMKAEAYTGDVAVCSKKVQQVYMRLSGANNNNDNQPVPILAASLTPPGTP
ncbi:hypothetical protein BG004_007970 [Podila humilis]|nr:hypothetical protein BG004_007970 [Podila humilis]